ncbi:hypothetical protein I317_02948 [Kwoniella heveanensis CBS 569]|uniref:N-acetylglucosaminylphosphatidylinositol deacetylase n=1 Tax=Kwoniella heveanensis BCC8398 TaxID=1296120 RepID=A0A1B9GLL5_9TREE|nr:hypothetical protein I316_06471 [Kwoniella heveanensis BCC8398]OCF43238.1 hypothetical protein I317_02948 [Kwoniella heveanensis CBS 569]
MAPRTLASRNTVTGPAQHRSRRRHSFLPLALLLAIILPVYLYARLYLLPSSSPSSSSISTFESSGGSRYDLKDLTDAAHSERGPGYDKPLQALLVTAHPDDEVMFFSPTILALVSQGWEVSGLCLSSGNSSGLGDIRTKELVRSYKALGVAPNHVIVIEAREFEDSMTAQWDPELIAASIASHGGLYDDLSEYRVDLIITFDDKGISNHPNHIALSRAIAYLPTPDPPRIIQLRSPATLPKFTGPLYAIYLYLKDELDILLTRMLSSVGTSTRTDSSSTTTTTPEGQQEPNTHIVVSSPAQWLQSVQAMMYHKSQLVWFRWLYLAFSRLMWINELVEVRQ